MGSHRSWKQPLSVVSSAQLLPNQQFSGSQLWCQMGQHPCHISFCCVLCGSRPWTHWQEGSICRDLRQLIAWPFQFDIEPPSIVLNLCLYLIFVSERKLTSNVTYTNPICNVLVCVVLRYGKHHNHHLEILWKNLYTYDFYLFFLNHGVYLLMKNMCYTLPQSCFIFSTLLFVLLICMSVKVLLLWYLKIRISVDTFPILRHQTTCSTARLWNLKFSSVNGNAARLASGSKDNATVLTGISSRDFLWHIFRNGHAREFPLRVCSIRVIGLFNTVYTSSSSHVDVLHIPRYFLISQIIRLYSFRFKKPRACDASLLAICISHSSHGFSSWVSSPQLLSPVWRE